jgi:hypothetical protein
MSMRQEKFIIICLRHDRGLDEDSFPVLREAVEAADPDWWRFLNPGTIMVFFVANTKAARRVDALLAEVQRLAKTNNTLAALTLGRSEGELVAEFNWRGRLKSTPIGVAANVSMREATSSTE